MHEQFVTSHKTFDRYWKHRFLWVVAELCLCCCCCSQCGGLQWCDVVSQSRGWQTDRSVCAHIECRLVFFSVLADWRWVKHHPRTHTWCWFHTWKPYHRLTPTVRSRDQLAEQFIRWIHHHFASPSTTIIAYYLILSVSLSLSTFLALLHCNSYSRKPNCVRLDTASTRIMDY